MSHNCPSPTSRNRKEDLQVLTVRVVKDRLGFSDQLNEHVADTKDLLVPYVERALGVSVRIDWSTVTDEELPAIKAWQEYCENLFDSCQEFAVEAVLAR